MKHVVMFSGGVGSWAAARRVREANPEDPILCLFADTLIEDADLYRFLQEAAADVAGELVVVAEGRTPWQVFFDKRYIGNSRIDPCSRILKRELLRKWLDDHCDPDDTTVYLGFDANEERRFGKARAYWSPWVVRAPGLDKPLMLKEHWFDELARRGIETPRLYKLGFPHNNCGGFCVKAGMGHFALLLDKLPEVYAHHEEQERRWRTTFGKNVAILRSRAGGKVTPLTLQALRLKLEKGQTKQLDLFDFGGCSCFSPDDAQNDANSNALS